ncbi:MAG: hypothetical protein QXU32_00250 [Nitrososphaerales archaeon]
MRNSKGMSKVRSTRETSSKEGRTSMTTLEYMNANGRNPYIQVFT